MQMSFKMKCIAVATATAIALSGCATQPMGSQSVAADSTPAPTTNKGAEASKPQTSVEPTLAAAPEIKLDVVYTTAYTDGSRLKDTPEEVLIVRPKNTQNNVATQAALNVALFALGGLSFKTFSKDDLKGNKLEDVKNRNNVRNPVATDFITQLRAQIKPELQSRSDLKTRVFKNSLQVAGGSFKLVYEGLTGDEANLYKMKAELSAYKRKESAGPFTVKPLVEVSCNRVSEKALPLEDWSKDDYVMVRQWVDETLDQCSKNVIAALPDLLAN
jgi:hypothetical protein